MESSTSDSLLTTSQRAMGYKLGPMDVSTRVNGKTVSNMGRDHIRLKTQTLSLGCGKKENM